MAKGIGSQTSWTGGIADDAKIGIRNSVAFIRGVDYRTSPSELRLTPSAIVDSGSVVTSLVMWGERACDALWFYDQAGSIYKRTTDGTWSKQHTASESSGNGLKYFGEDGNLYYAQNTTIGRLTRACEGDGKFVDDFLGVDGGEPTNTKSIQLVRTSSQYADIVDNANLSITGDLTMEIYAKLATLPSTGDEYVLMSKWQDTGQQSYRLYITTSTNYFGDGRDGALTINSNVTDNPTDANCTGTAGDQTLTISNLSSGFSVAAGDKLIIHQTRGTGAGQYMENEVVSSTATTIQLKKPLTFSPQHSTSESNANRAQVLVARQYTTVDISATYTAKTWDGLKGGILVFYSNSTCTITSSGIINASAKGFRGGRFYNDSIAGADDAVTGESGESPTGQSKNFLFTPGGTVPSATGQTNGGGGAGGNGRRGPDLAAGGGGGSYATLGETGTVPSPAYSLVGGLSGETYGDKILTLAYFGSGGGGGGKAKDNDVTGEKRGGRGGGIIMPFCAELVVQGKIVANGGDGDPNAILEGQAILEAGGNGGGSGGTILTKSVDVSLGTASTATGGFGANSLGKSGNGGNGGDGRIALYYATSFSGTSTPAYTAIQDETLNNADGYSLVLQLSNDGTASEKYVWDISDLLNTTNWNRYQVTWDDATSTAEGFINSNLLGTITGSFTSIYDSTANFAIGADFDSGGTAQNFYNGLLDDARLWNDIRTDSELASKLNKVLSGADANLIAYYEFEDDVTDSQSNVTANDLTANNSPTYSEDVPFSGLTSRNDNDPNAQDTTPTGQTYTVPTSITEDGTGGAQRQDFVPAKEPLKSLTLNVNAVGTGDWTIKVHDVQNREVATVTVTNANMHTGFYEFNFDEAFRPTIGASYHFHVTSTVADGTIVTNTTADLNTAYYIMHYQFLVDDIYHPIAQILNKLAIGNERYVATLEGGDVYENDTLILPSGYRVRALSYWREYLAIGVWRTATTNPSITDYDEGYIFFWDGTKDTYNYFITVPEGGINALYGSGNILYGIAGYSGDIIAYTGGDKAQKVKKIPRLALEKYLEVAPGSMTMWKTLLRMGINLETDSEDVQKGVYSFGTLNVNYPHSLGFEHPLSLGENTSSATKIGMVFPAGQDLYIGWQSGNAYGVDRVSNSNPPYQEGVVEMLITDMGQISRDKNPITLRADFENLIDGQGVAVKYKVKRGREWNYSDVEDTVDATNVRIPAIKAQTNEIQVAVELYSNNDVESPVVTGLTLQTELEEKNRAI